MVLDPHEFLKSLAVVLCTAGLATVVCQWLRQPVVLGYLVAGLVVGPHLPVPLVADPAVVTTLSELGVILLMFSLGLEFSLTRFLRMGPKVSLTALLETSVMMLLGFAAGRLLGWSVIESAFAGSIVAISSTTIIAKAFAEQRVGGGLKDLVIGILIVEDLIAILLMATLTAVAAGSQLSAAAIALTTARLAAFLVGLVVVGLLVIPRVVRAIARLDRPETTLISSIGICFAIALLAQKFGYSVALGAFVAGSLIAESGEQHAIESLIRPVRDLFAAVFFVSVGMLMDPELVVEHWFATALFALLVVAGKIAGVALGAFLTGNGIRLSIQAGMSLAQIGEFSFIIAGLGLALGVTRDFLYPIAIAVSAVTTLTTPWLIRAAGPVAQLVDRKLPRPLQTFAALYGSWIERMRSPAQPQARGAVKRLIRLLLLDGALLAAVAIGASLGLARITAWLEATLGAGPAVARRVAIGAAVVLGMPFAVGLLRVARRLGATLAMSALPAAAAGRLDLADAPRRALVVTLQIVAMLCVGLPLLVLTQPFLPGLPGPAVLGLVLLALGLSFWRSATGLQGHVRAGAEMIVEVLGASSRQPSLSAEAAALSEVRELLPGLGEPVALELGSGSPALGRTLAELNLRGVTGATVLAITRGEGGVIVPTAREVLCQGDRLALAGTHEAIDAARALLGGGTTG